MKVDVMKDKIIAKYYQDKTCVIFKMADNTTYVLYHYYECSELVELVEIIGNSDDLIGYPLLMCECEENRVENPDSCTGSYFKTWTFYKFATVKGYVTLRWVGESNGYYSEEVDFIEATSGDAWYLEQNVSKEAFEFLQTHCDFVAMH